MRGVVLAGGTGSRMRPTSDAINKHLAPLFDRPVVYYPLATLAEAGARELLVVVPNETRGAFERLLGDGSALGLDVRFAEQPRPVGIADALRLARGFAAGGPVAVALGDNVWIDAGTSAVPGLGARGDRAVVCCRRVADPRPYGVVELDDRGVPLRVVEKPARPASDLAAVGLYAFPSDLFDVADAVRPSARGEAEIADVLNAYAADGRLEALPLPESGDWFDAGTAETLLDAANRVATRPVGQRTAGAPELAAARQGWLDRTALESRTASLRGSAYGAMLAHAAIERRGEARQ